MPETGTCYIQNGAVTILEFIQFAKMKSQIKTDEKKQFTKLKSLPRSSSWELECSFSRFHQPSSVVGLSGV